MLSPWVPADASNDRVNDSAKLMGTSAATGKCKRQWLYYRVGCPYAQGVGDGVHFTSDQGAEQILNGGLAKALRRFIQCGEIE